MCWRARSEAGRSNQGLETGTRLLTQLLRSVASGLCFDVQDSKHAGEEVVLGPSHTSGNIVRPASFYTLTNCAFAIVDTALTSIKVQLIARLTVKKSRLFEHITWGLLQSMLKDTLSRLDGWVMHLAWTCQAQPAHIPNQQTFKRINQERNH